MHEQGVVQKAQGTRAAQPRGQLQLPPCARQQVFAANNDVDVVRHVVHHDGKLVGPLRMAVAHEQVAALLLRPLLEGAEAEIMEPDALVGHPHASRERLRRRHHRVAAGAGIARFLPG